MKDLLERVIESYSVYYEKEFRVDFDPEEHEDEIKTGKFGLAYYETDDLEYQFSVILDINEQAILYYVNDVLYDLFTYHELNKPKEEAIDLMIKDLELCNYDDYLSQTFNDDALRKHFKLEWSENMETLVKKDI